MKRVFGIIGVVAVLAILIGASFAIMNQPKKEVSWSDFSYNNIVTLADETDYNGINPDKVATASDATGDLPEKLIGSSSAPVIIYEYADYACTHCAEANTALKKLVEDYNGKVAVAFRNYLLKGYPHNVMAGSAASAAAIQGYWEKFKNLLFSDQATWFYLSDSKAKEFFGDLFVEASDGAGDLNKFYEDMESEAVAKKLAFDYAMSDNVGITATPTFRLNGEKITIDGGDFYTSLKSAVDSALTK